MSPKNVFKTLFLAKMIVPNKTIPGICIYCPRGKKILRHSFAHREDSNVLIQSVYKKLSFTDFPRRGYLERSDFPFSSKLRKWLPNFPVTFSVPIGNTIRFAQTEDMYFNVHHSLKTSRYLVQATQHHRERWLLVLAQQSGVHHHIEWERTYPGGGWVLWEGCYSLSGYVAG